MINRIITWLRRNDEMLEPLRKQIEQQEKPVDWDKLHTILMYVIFITTIIGFGVMFAMWISL